MKFQVPQFIDTEDKIFGPLSFKEFAYIAGGCGLSYILYRFIPSFLFALLFIVPVLGFAAALAFYKPNNKPFIEMVQSAIEFSMGNKLYIWKKENKVVKTAGAGMKQRTDPDILIPDLSENKLKHMNMDLGMQAKSSENKSINDSLNLKI